MSTSICTKPPPMPTRMCTMRITGTSMATPSMGASRTATTTCTAAAPPSPALPGPAPPPPALVAGLRCGGVAVLARFSFEALLLLVAGHLVAVRRTCVFLVFFAGRGFTGGAGARRIRRRARCLVRLVAQALLLLLPGHGVTTLRFTRSVGRGLGEGNASPSQQCRGDDHAKSFPVHRWLLQRVDL